MKQTKILFVCKYNRFRSRIAEAYFNKVNKNKNIVAESAGVIEGFLPLDKNQIKTAEKFGFSILGKPRTTSMEMLRDFDKIIIVANDVPKSIFSYFLYKDKVIKWNIPDVVEGKSIDENEKIVKKIIKKVDELNKKLEKQNGN